MLGDISEKPARKAAPLVVGTMQGFPSAKQVITSNRAPVPVVQSIIKEKVKNYESNDIFTSKSMVESTLIQTNKLDDSDANVNFINAMSQSERKEALEEISALLSPKSIKFLQNNSIPNLDMEKPLIDVKTTHKITRPVPVPVNGNTGTKNMCTDRKIDNIKKREMQEDSDYIMNDRNISRPLFMTYERFDLNGRKVVDLNCARDPVMSEIEQSGLFKEFPKITDKIIALCVSSAMSLSQSSDGSHFVVLVNDSEDVVWNQSLGELCHHPLNQQSPGYNFTEIIEVSYFLLFHFSCYLKKVSFNNYFWHIDVSIHCHAPTRARDAHSDRDSTAP